MKTNKSFTKRIKVTKNGKLAARKPGQGHFNAKESGQKSMAKKRSSEMNLTQKIKRRFLPRTK